MSDQNEELSLSRVSTRVIADEDESEIEYGPLEDVKVTEAPPPPPPPTPKFNLAEHAARTPEEESAEKEQVAVRESGRPSPRYYDIRKEGGKKAAVTRKTNVAAARAADPDLAEEDRQTAELNKLAEENGNIDFYDLESEKELQDWLKKTRVQRYKETLSLAKSAKNENIKFRALQMLDNRDLGRPSAAPPPDNEGEPGGIIL